jgi:hypothetical protein
MKHVIATCQAHFGFYQTEENKNNYLEDKKSSE